MAHVDTPNEGLATLTQLVANLTSLTPAARQFVLAMVETPEETTTVVAPQAPARTDDGDFRDVIVRRAKNRAANLAEAGYPATGRANRQAAKDAWDVAVSQVGKAPVARTTSPEFREWDRKVRQLREQLLGG